ncbi:putative zinc/iron permease [Lupinus albus]|uniref:Putative zinc/iron permease n=2 Tax=Lupinus albus TaxID=3870 RepID=A0A6A4R312_LUPAL|nr:putative zinc/iron permease [Lupinus albus]
MIKFSRSKILSICAIILLQQNLVLSKCVCDEKAEDQNHNTSLVLKYKIIGMSTTLVASIIGICLPILGQKLSFLNPENDLFFLAKAFAAGVILATGFIHILPDAFDALTNPCIGEIPWTKFPFTGFVAMVAAIGTLILESMVMGHLKRSELLKAQPLNNEDEVPHAVYGAHEHGVALDRSKSRDRLRHLIVSQVILFHCYC